MGYPYYRFFTGDYMQDTMHLGWLEDCAYRRLIDLYLLHGNPIRNDRAYIMRAIRAFEPEQQNAADVVLSEFFQLRADGWHQSRCDAEIKWRNGKTELGRRAALSKKFKQNNKMEADAQRTHNGRTTNQNQNQEPLKSNTLSSKGSTYREDAKQILEYLNGVTGKQFRPVDANLKPIEARLRSGITMIQAYEVIMAKWDEWGNDEKMHAYVRPKTIFSASNFENYLGQLNLEES